MKQILVVEDEPEIQEFLSAYLRHEGYSVTAAGMLLTAAKISKLPRAAAVQRLWEALLFLAQPCRTTKAHTMSGPLFGQEAIIISGKLGAVQCMYGVFVSTRWS